MGLGRRASQKGHRQLGQGWGQCHASRETGADRSATRLCGMGVVPCTSARGRGRVMLPSALTTARWEVGSGSCMRVILVREPGGSTAESPLTVNSWSRPWDTPTTERTTWLGPRVLGGGGGGRSGGGGVEAGGCGGRGLAESDLAGGGGSWGGGG